MLMGLWDKSNQRGHTIAFHLQRHAATWNAAAWMESILSVGEQRATAWPTVFHLHGADEGVDGQCSECYWPAAAAPLRRIAGHGLPHRIEYRTPFNEQFVLVSPQRPPTNNITGDGYDHQWEEQSVMGALEQLVGQTQLRHLLAQRRDFP